MRTINILIFACLAISSSGQILSTSAPGSTTGYNMLVDLKGEALKETNGVVVEGTPFYSSEWSRGSIMLADNKKYTNVLLRLNLHTDKVHYLLDDLKTERVASVASVVEVAFDDPETKSPVRFRCGYPVVERNDLKTFYKVLTDGKATLLKQEKHVLSEDKPFNSATLTKRFDINRDYFVFINQAMVPIKRTKSDLSNALADQKEKVEQFIAENKLRLKEDQDLVKLFQYYNSL